jgi:hypothetical protein
MTKKSENEGTKTDAIDPTRPVRNGLLSENDLGKVSGGTTPVLNNEFLKEEVQGDPNRPVVIGSIYNGGGSTDKTGRTGRRR